MDALLCMPPSTIEEFIVIHRLPLCLAREKDGHAQTYDDRS